MDETRFDRITRRLVLGGLLAAMSAPSESNAAKKLSKRKRCKRKRRDL